MRFYRDRKNSIFLPHALLLLASNAACVNQPLDPTPASIVIVTFLRSSNSCNTNLALDLSNADLPCDRLSTGHLCAVADDVIAIHNHTHIKFVFLRTGKSRILVPPGNRGVSVIGGRDDSSLLAWSDIGPPAPKVHVYKYSAPLNIITLEGRIFI